ncbi:M23 family metallopeptidase [Sodalinema gerasimenkoae]|uniref:M23 family metallopeptidase n=1 Tax=Sodalinema gerasimenkoae TaxID=2862348 RepID=UPI0013595B91|nr:M23 family metallopeptidase [Sodalinema gerasimenkoae]
MPGFDSLADTAGEESQQGESASNPSSLDRPLTPSNTATESPSSDPLSSNPNPAQTNLSGQSKSVDSTIDSFPDDAKSPLNLIARSAQRPIEGLAASLPANLAKPVDRNWRIGGYRVSDTYLPCQQPDGSDCRTQHPVTGYQDVAHWGVDLAMPYGAPLYAVGKEGSEVKVSCYYDGGKGLVAQLSSSSFPTYEFEAFHLSDCLPGTHKAGSLFAAVGNSGISNGPHLHWEAYWYGQRVNPPRWSLEFVVTGKIQVSQSNKYIY